MMTAQRLICLGLGLGWLAGCATTGGEATPEVAGRTLVYECGDFEFVVHARGTAATLYLPDDYRELAQVRSASGTKYESGDTVFRSQGDEAMLDIGSRKYRGCLLNRSRAPWEDARRRGVDFRAVGQEPGWVLEIRQEATMLMEADYGSTRVLLPTPEPDIGEDMERYDASGGGHRLTVQIRLEFCYDTMSGETYSSRVTAVLDGREYRGCGETLDPL